MTRTSKLLRLKEAASQFLCVLLVNGDSDEMLSSWSYRTRSRLEPWINWLFRDVEHCKKSYEWERAHYNVQRFQK